MGTRPVTTNNNGDQTAAALDTGWRPWKVVVGNFCLTVPTYGLLSSVGLFQTEISWIISVFGFVMCLFAGPCGVLFDRYGSGWLLAASTSAYAGSFVGLAFSATYAHFMGCLMVAGISATAPTTVAFSVMSQWFSVSVREGLATGCVTVGAAFAVLVLSAIILGFMALGNALVETNMSHHRRRTASGSSGTAWDGAVVSKILTSSRFWLVSYAIFGQSFLFLSQPPPNLPTAYELVLFIQLGSIPTYAVLSNFGDKQFYLVMSYNIGAIIGRTAPLWLSDRKLGPLNTIIMMNMFTLLVVLLIWLPFGSTVQGLFTAIVLLGIGTGSFVPLGVSCVSALCGPVHTGTWLGSVYTVVSFATLIGNLATGAILAAYKSDGLIAFLAVVLLSGLISATALRWLCHGRRLILRRKI
ncbi:major facilitator superfamily domain-containing protein [Apodospora peruviana]|uniref:Major facilitator superfamily domain-containing protein n=1 Tax=Apodospora peruviana TaxID=516989 RepID=A0AAE0ISW8_9PEZI|nr:major facilitator superfamily domain-containing protein [Apodospora peruviana]